MRSQTLLVPSTDGVRVALHELFPVGAPLLVTHAQGFHGRCYGPMAEALRPPRRAWGMDARGHGETAVPADWVVDWEGFFADTAACATASGVRVAAFGHSMGAVLLLRTAHRNPSQFSALVLYEPALFPPSEGDEDTAHLGRAMAANVRRRRARFDSIDAAVQHFASKPPMGAFTDDALRAYVEHGFRVDAGGVAHLACTPEFEAQSYEHYPIDDFWDQLPEIETPTLLLAGDPTAFRPSRFDELIAARLRNGSFRRLDGLGHFGPMTHPERVAEAVSTFLTS